MDRNNTRFPMTVHEYLRGRKWNPHSGLLYHQFLTLEYLLANPKQRGILGFYDMGLGKTHLAASLARKSARLRKTVVIAPKSVHGQFADEFKRVGYTGKVQYISLKASNMAKQVERLDAIPGLRIISGSLDNSVVIVDEAHNLFNSVSNGSQNAVDFYDMAMDAKGIKLLFLSGSPVINHPFELVPCYNMIAGMRLFNESKEDFEKYFIGDGQMINRDKFMNRIAGLTSYYGEQMMTPDMIAKMPEMKPLQEIMLPMSEQQYVLYNAARDKEREESKRSSRPRPNERFGARHSSSTYRVNSRKASNLVPLNNATDEDLLDPKNSPKFHYLLQTLIPKHKKQPGIILSGFVHDCGLQDLGRLMVLKGWERWESGMTADPTAHRFAILSGDETLEEREQIRNAANLKSNKHGEVIRVLLIGPAAVEGTNLRRFRWAVQLDPFHNETRLDQGRKRVRRMNSHEDLPPEERNVQPYILLADYPEGVKTPSMEPSTDIHMATRARANRVIHNQFFKCMIESSIDCAVHRDKLPPELAKSINCMICAPTGEPLWTQKIEVDMLAENPCTPPVTEKIKAQELVLETPQGRETYMYRVQDGLYEFYYLDPQLNGYVKVPRNHHYWDALVAGAQN